MSAATAAAPGAANGVAPQTATSSGLLLWEEAQRPYVESSHRVADALQSALAQKFPGSPATSTQFAVRELRSVAAPAIAVEVSSVTAGDSNSLLAIGASLTGTIERIIQAIRPPGSLPASAGGTAGAK